MDLSLDSETPLEFADSYDSSHEKPTVTTSTGTVVAVLDIDCKTTTVEDVTEAVRKVIGRGDASVTLVASKCQALVRLGSAKDTQRLLDKGMITIGGKVKRVTAGADAQAPVAPVFRIDKLSGKMKQPAARMRLFGMVAAGKIGNIQVPKRIKM